MKTNDHKLLDDSMFSWEKIFKIESFHGNQDNNSFENDVIQVEDEEVPKVVVYNDDNDDESSEEDE
jgi:hypothetical protein